MNILIVEDEEVVSTKLSQLLADFPDSTIKIVATLRDAMSMIQSQSAPDIVLLDLTLQDSSRENTAANVPTILKHCPRTVIVTGHDADIVREMEGIGDVPIAEKAAVFGTRGLIHSIISALWAKPQGAVRPDAGRRTEEILQQMKPFTQTPNAT